MHRRYSQCITLTINVKCTESLNSANHYPVLKDPVSDGSHLVILLCVIFLYIPQDSQVINLLLVAVK